MLAVLPLNLLLLLAPSPTLASACVITAHELVNFDDRCQAADEISIGADIAVFRKKWGVHASNFDRYMSNKRTINGNKMRIELQIQHLNFPELEVLNLNVIVEKNPHVRSICFPKLKIARTMDIYGNPNLLDIHINGEAKLEELRIQSNVKLREDKLAALRKLYVSSRKKIQSGTDCNFTSVEITSLKELDGCTRISGVLVFSKDVTDVDYPLKRIKFDGCVHALNTQLTTLSFLDLEGRSAGCKTEQGTGKYSIVGNKYLCDPNLCTDYDIADCSTECEGKCTDSSEMLNAGPSACRTLLFHVNVDKNHQHNDLGGVRDFRQGLRIVNTTLTGLETVLGATERIYTTGETALEILDNKKLERMDLSRLKVLRSAGKIKVRIARNGVMVTKKEREEFLKRTGLTEDEVEIDEEVTTTTALFETSSTGPEEGTGTTTKTRAAKDLSDPDYQDEAEMQAAEEVEERKRQNTIAISVAVSAGLVLLLIISVIVGYLIRQWLVDRKKKKTLDTDSSTMSMSEQPTMRPTKSKSESTMRAKGESTVSGVEKK